MSDDFDFQNEIEKANWDMIEPHYKRGALFVVEGLDLVEVATAMARDDVQTVKNWLDEGFLRRLFKKEVEAFELDSKKYICEFVIVQPYVVLKLLSGPLQ